MARRFSPQRMKQARLSAGMSHAELARAISKGETSVGRWERGDHTPRGESVVAIAHATGRDIEFFYTETEAAESDEEEAALRRHFRQLEGTLVSAIRQARDGVRA